MRVVGAPWTNQPGGLGWNFMGVHVRIRFQARPSGLEVCHGKEPSPREETSRPAATITHLSGSRISDGLVRLSSWFARGRGHCGQGLHACAGSQATCYSGRLSHFLSCIHVPVGASRCRMGNIVCASIRSDQDGMLTIGLVVSGCARAWGVLMAVTTRHTHGVVGTALRLLAV